MSHVDEGELTAYADGAYPADDPEALRIGAHLSACDNCRTRLEQAHELRDRAAAILGYATPVVLTAPSFESLQAQLATSSAKPRRNFNLGWAASIIMAVGLGWFGRGAWQNPPARSDMAVEVAAPAATRDVPTEEIAAAPPAAATAPPITTETRLAPPPTRERRMGGAAGVGTARSEAVSAGKVAGDQAVAAAPPPPSPSASVAEADFAAADAVANRQYMSAADAERRGITVPRIPELAIVRIEVRADATVVQQSLPDGKVVQLSVAPEAVAMEMRAQRSAAREAAPEMARVQKAVVADVVVRQNGKVITVTGDLPPDSLRALARKIK